MHKYNKLFSKIKGNVPDAYIFTIISGTLMYIFMIQNSPLQEMFFKATIFFVGFFVFIRIYCFIFAEDYKEYSNKEKGNV